MLPTSEKGHKKTRLQKAKKHAVEEALAAAEAALEAAEAMTLSTSEKKRLKKKHLKLEEAEETLVEVNQREWDAETSLSTSEKKEAFPVDTLNYGVSLEDLMRQDTCMRAAFRATGEAATSVDQSIRDCQATAAKKFNE